MRRFLTVYIGIRNNAHGLVSYNCLNINISIIFIEIQLISNSLTEYNI